nr:glycosyltransferase [Faecalicatena faecalis]
MEKNIIIMYSGKLDIDYGICLLLDAFMQIKEKNVELWITGGGNAESFIKKCMDSDQRIKYFGFLPSRQKVLNMQKKATLLINMRLPSEPASSYCFPSKLFEYMVTGVPVLSFKLDGIPEEYYNYLVTIEKETIDSVKETIESVIHESTDVIRNRGRAAREYILKHKNSVKQCESIWNWIMEENKAKD